MNCIICQDTGSEPIKDNKNCTCKYKYHSSCWIDYVHSKDKVICPLCRKDLTIKKSKNIKIKLPARQSPPYTSRLNRTEERQETHQQNTYQELANDNNVPISQSNPSSTPNPSSQSYTTKKILKLIVGLCIILVIVTFIVLVIL